MPQIPGDALTPEEVAAKFTILRCVVGSKLYGTDNADSDVDEMGVCIEPVEVAMGFTSFEQCIRQKKDETTGLTLTESKIYSLKKFIRLLLGGNPDVTPLLFVPAEFQTVSTATGRQLQDLAYAVVSRRCGVKFLGYMESQRQRMLGEIGQKKVNRPDLLAKFGYDTKYAMQLIRLGINGVELMTTGRITLPMYEKDRNLLKGIRAGQHSMNDVLQRAGDLEQELRDAMGESPLPEEANTELVEGWMIDTYWRHWKANRFMLDRLHLAPELDEPNPCQS